MEKFQFYVLNFLIINIKVIFQTSNLHIEEDFIMMYKIIVETAVYVEADSREQAENIAVNAVGYGLNEQAVSDYDYIESHDIIECN